MTEKKFEIPLFDPQGMKLDEGMLDVDILWKEQQAKENRRLEAQMFSSLIDRKIQSLILRALDEHKSLKTMPQKLETEDEFFEMKVDLSQTALKKFDTTLDNSETHFIKRNQQILSEIKFCGQFSLMDKWHTLVVWKHIKDRSVIDRNVENPKDDLNYISAVVYPRGNSKPYSVFYGSRLSDTELEKSHLESSVFDKKQLKLDSNKKVIMVSFDQAEGLSWNFNDDTYGIGEFSIANKHRVSINSMQERFAYVRQYLCGVSQNYLAFELQRNFGINIDQKGVKYWEEHKTENPSFRKNYWEEVTNLLTELSYGLLNTPMRMELNSKFKDMPQILDMDFVSIKMFIEDFILFGTQDSNRFDIPELILNTTKPVKPVTEVDFIYERGKSKILSQMKLDVIKEKDVADDPTILHLWFDILLNKDNKEIFADLDSFVDDEKHKKQIYYLWHRINEQYDIETENEGKKPPF